MSKLSIPLLCALFIVGLFACQSEKNDSSTETKTWELVPSGEKIEIELDSLTANVALAMEYYDEGDSPLLFNVNSDKNALQIYDVDAGKLQKELVFEAEGPNGVRVGFFHVHNLDSIFIFPEWSQKLILVDGEGQIKNRIDYELPENVSALFLHNTYYVSPPKVVDGQLIAKTRGTKSPMDYSQSELDEFPVLVSIDLTSKEVTSLPYHFPTDYFSQGIKMMEVSIVQDVDRTVFSFAGDHALYFSDSGNLTKKDGASAFLDAPLPVLPEDVDGRIFAEYALTKSRYSDLIKDPYRNVLYRFAFPTEPVQSEEELRALRENPRSFILMVFDENLELLTEKKFDAGTYYPSNSFVGEKGLYLSTSNSQNPEIKEDWMAFELIELVGK